MPRKKKPKLVTQFLENISRDALESQNDVVDAFVSGRTGIYALYRRGQLYYTGLATNLRHRLKAHLKDRHSDSWDSFSVYLTIGDNHLRELESLVIRMVLPPGNTQIGRFSGAEDLFRRFRRAISDKQRIERERILGRTKPVQSDVPKIAKSRPIRAPYKGKTYRATLRADFSVRMGGKKFESPSGAAAAITERPTNGWWFWHFERSPGDWVRIKEMRG